MAREGRDVLVVNEGVIKVKVRVCDIELWESSLDVFSVPIEARGIVGVVSNAELKRGDLE